MSERTQAENKAAMAEHLIGRYKAKVASELAAPGSATDPDLGELNPGHVCKHGIRWPHRCDPCADAAWELHQRQSPNAPASATPNPEASHGK